MESEKQIDAAAAAAAAAPGYAHLPPVEEGGDASPPPGQKHPRKKLKETIIDHTYRDYSQVKVADESDEEENELWRAEPGKKKKQIPFPQKVHMIVSNPNYQHIICWLPHGRAWRIVDKHLLTTVILPKYFAHNRFESFNRSVNGWGFKRILSPGPDCKAYYHECFLRGRPDLCKLMQRLVNPGKRLPDKAGEPDFYEISEKYPLPPLEGKGPPTGPGTITVAAPSPAAAQPSPAAAQPPMWASPSPHANPYMYGYPMPGLPPPAMSPASGNQPQHPYWQSPPGSSPPFQPPPYGYYPYPPIMMGPQGGYYMPQPYPPPESASSIARRWASAEAYNAQYYPPAPAAPDKAPPAQAEAPPALETKAEPGTTEEAKPAAPEAAAGKDVKKTEEEAKPAGKDAGAEAKKEASKGKGTKKKTDEPKDSSTGKRSSKRAAKGAAEDEKSSKKGKVDGKDKKESERKNARRSPRTTSL